MRIVALIIILLLLLFFWRLFPLIAILLAIGLCLAFAGILVGTGLRVGWGWLTKKV